MVTNKGRPIYNLKKVGGIAALQEILFGVLFLSTLKQALKQPARMEKEIDHRSSLSVRSNTISFNEIDNWVVRRKVRPPTRVHKKKGVQKLTS